MRNKKKTLILIVILIVGALTFRYKSKFFAEEV